MKLHIELDALWGNVAAMGAQKIEVDINHRWSDHDLEFDTLLSTSGIDIDITQVGTEEGLLNYRGRQVLLFIPDHSFRVDDVITDPSKGNKYHVADCKKLEEMKSKNRFERYKVTNNISGIFEIYGTSRNKKLLEGTAALDVCKLCLKKLNFKGAANETVAGRNKIVHNFGLDEFFSTYSSLFKHYPKTKSKDAKKGYTKDWGDVSLKVRCEANYCCAHCNVSLVDTKGLLHAHHRNGEKSDNRPHNLVPLCADCHRKEPYHAHMHVKHADIRLINHLRREQSLLDNNEWTGVFKYADPACRGILSHCQKNGYSPPEVGYELVASMGQVIAEFELAWPHKKTAVVLNNVLAVEGWRVFGLDDAISFFGRTFKN